MIFYIKKRGGRRGQKRKERRRREGDREEEREGGEKKKIRPQKTQKFKLQAYMKEPAKTQLMGRIMMSGDIKGKEGGNEQLDQSLM